MREPEGLSQLIGDIYDAALDSSLWGRAVEKSVQFIGGFSAGLGIRDQVNPAANLDCLFGLPHNYERYEQLYFEELGKFDPRDWSLVKVGQVTSNSTFMPYGEFCETRFFREWMLPQGVGDNLVCILDRSPTSYASFSAFRHESNGPADEAALRCMRLVMPHMRRAVLIAKAMNLKQAEVASFADTIDGLSAGVFLVDAHRQIVHANASGHALLANGTPLRATGGKLALNEKAATRRLGDSLASAGNGHARVSGRSISLPLRAHDADRYVAHLLPLTSGARRRTGVSYQAVAALLVHKAGLETSSPSEIIAKAFKLTPSEVRVLLGIVEVGGGVQETADALGIAVSTVRTHLAHVFAKTGTSRQADLVKLVAGFSNPLARPTR